MVASMAPVVFPVVTASDTNTAAYPFTMEQFRRVTELHDLNDAVDTDLRPFAAHGGKLILYHGWSDTSIPPLTTVAYYTAVQRDLGNVNVDRFLKLFMIPGKGHCGGGDGFSQLETLTPLMAWVEQGKAPIMLEGDKVQGGRGPTQLPCRRSTPVNATVPDKLKRLIHAVFRLFAISGSDPLIFSFFPTQICPLDQLP